MSIQVQYTREGLKNRILKEPDQAIRYLEMGWHLHQLVSYEEAIRAYERILQTSAPMTGGNP